MAPLEEFRRDTSDRIQMDTSVKYHDKESMKRAIMKQDAIFRQQVHQLHSLYRAQKQLMTNLKITEKNVEQRNVGNDTGSCRSHYSHKEKTRPSRTEEENDLELTLATGLSRKKRGSGSYTSDSGNTFSSSSTDSGRSKLMPHLQSHILSETKSSFDLEEGKLKKRFEPPWSLPCLSLKIG